MTNQPERLNDIDGRMLAFGVVLGMVVGGILTLFTAPRRTKDVGQAMTTLTERARVKIETAAPSDPIEESFAVGRAAARRRREELGLPVTDAPDSVHAAPR
jgi:gas vesicle protein